MVGSQGGGRLTGSFAGPFALKEVGERNRFGMVQEAAVRLSAAHLLSKHAAMAG